MKNTTVHMIGNAHIDPIWLWRWQEGFAEVLATCRSALDRMNETPEFTFSRSSSATYKWIEQVAPEMFEEIRRRVAEGRWEIVNGWVEQPDCNIPSGESFVRQALYGKRYFLDRFGKDVVTGWNLDSFGHNSGLPQILRKSGFDHYVFMRPGPNEKDLPEPIFWWEGPDGSRILTVRLSGPYGSGPDDIRDKILRAADQVPNGLTQALCFYGVGNHGGGPTKANIAAIQAVNEDPEAPRTVFSTVRRFLSEVMAERSEFPVVSEDLQHHAPGCYSVHTGVKEGNRRCELALNSAEKFAALAKRELGTDYPAADFQRAWELALFCQFHDSLAGTSLMEAYDDVRDMHGWAAWVAAEHLNTSLQSFAQKIDTQGDGFPLVVFNPLPWPVKQPVEYSSKLDTLADESGRVVSTQLDELRPTECRVFGKTRVFMADLPPLGWKVYRTGAKVETAAAERFLAAGEDFLENDWWHIQFDKEGRLSSVFDKEQAVEVLSGPVTAVAHDDPSDTWGHTIVSIDNPAGEFIGGKAELVESGPVRAAMLSTSRFSNSSIRQKVMIYRDTNIIEGRMEIDWHEEQRALKLVVPLAVDEPKAACGAAYAYADRSTSGTEDPFQQWIDVSGKISGKPYGAALLCEGKYGCDIKGSEIRLTILRSPAYALHDPMVIEPDKQYIFMDQGRHWVTWRLVPHSGDWREGAIPRQAEMFANPPVPVISFSHPGDLPPVASMVSISPENVILGALKMSEEGEDLIVRLYESEGRRTEAKMKIGGAETSVLMNPYELKTLKITSDGRASEVDLLERPL